jgi:hypothetical protein
MFQANGIPMQAGVAIFISDKADYPSEGIKD